MTKLNDQENLRDWFLATKREFAWRQERSLYRVLISEVMLQQTRAEVVIPYFDRWIERFPTLQDLKEADIDEVIKLWEGLGYYSRARNLHKAAQMLEEKEYSYEELLAISGIGPYTAKAIEAFAFNRRALAIDGNVRRVLSRYYASDQFEEVAKEFLPEEKPFEIAEGLIELGAKICKIKPLCDLCPLSEGCKSYQEGRVLEFPKKAKRVVITNLHFKVYLFFHEGSLAVRREVKGKRMADLYEFYQEPMEESGPFSKIKAEPLEKETMHFTRYRALLEPFIIRSNQIPEGYEFIKVDELLKKPFSSGHRRILHKFLRLGYS